MKRNYKYEREMLHWLDGGDIEQKYSFLEYDGWEPFNGEWTAEQDMEYRIAESRSEELLAEKQRWLYVNYSQHLDHWFSHQVTDETIGKIRMEDV